MCVWRINLLGRDDDDDDVDKGWLVAWVRGQIECGFC